MTKTKELAAKSDVAVQKKKAMWLGSQNLMGKVVSGSKEDRERQLVRMTAGVLNVSPFGVNILGNLPYINKLGLAQKSQQYSTGRDTFLYNWVKFANDDNEKAICQCKIVRDGKDITDWVLGECSPKTIKMGTLQGYQNHMAQTRARNRAILEAYSVKIHEEMITNIGKLESAKAITPKQAAALTEQAGRTSSSSIEEIVSDGKEKTGPINPDLFDSRIPAPAGHTVEPLESGPELICHGVSKSGCGNDLTAQEYEFSMKRYGKPLCREHQKLATPLSAKK